ncbi:MAG: hypothetical protein SGILL_004752, partial [Bacillariaceae sp.]
SSGESTDDDDFFSEDDLDVDGAKVDRNGSPHFASMEEMPMDERREYAKEQAERRLEALAICTSGDDPASNFCDSTIPAMHEMCGGGSSKPKEDTLKRTLALGEKHSIAHAGGVEEQTAIEVEYVEPMYRGKNGDDDMYSPKRKNALLRAMSRKAKDDFNSSKSGSSKKTKEESRDTSPTTDDEGMNVGAAHPSSENVYASFSPSEKRKFLKLINGGMTPFDATSQVMKERMESEEKSLASSYDEPDGNNNRAIAAGAVAATGAAASRGSKKDKKNKSERALASTPAAADRSPKVSEAAPSESRMNRGGVMQDSDEDDQEIVDGFARSGISYYDAVRRDRSAEDLDDDEEPETNRPKSKSPSMKFPRMGFSKLSKTASNDEDAAPSTPPQSTSRGAVAVQPHVSIPSPVVVQDEEEQLRSMPTPPAPPQQHTDTEGLARPIPVKADSDSPPRDYDIPPVMSSESLLTEEDHPGEEKKADDGYGGSDPGATIEDELTAQMLTVRRSQSLEEHLHQPALDHRSRSPQIDLDIDTYLNSTETLSQYGANGNSFDNHSVVSGKSYRTSQTAGTNFTQSTRTLRPGQAKLRLNKEKKAQQKKPTGWQESIQAAAAASGRVWDPEYGWKDYVDPKTVGTEDDMGVQNSDELIHVPVDRLRRKAEDEDSLLDGTAEPGSPARVGFPPDWDEERSDMLREEHAGMERSLAPSTPGRRHKNPKVVSPARDDKPRGWKETMAAATANISQDGKRWDPERGWVGPDGEVITLAANLEKEREYLEQVAVVADSDTQDFGTVRALDAIADKNQDSGMQFLSDSEEHGTDHEIESTTRSIETRSVEARSTGGRYMQIKDTGSVQSHYRNPAVQAVQARQQQLRSMGQDVIPEEGEQSMARNALTGASPATKEMFDKMDQARGGANATNVQRDSLGQGEAALFAAGQGAKLQQRSGPVDLDEIFDEEIIALEAENDENRDRKLAEDADNDGNTQLSNDSFGAAPDFSWDEDDTQDHEIPNPNRKSVPRLKVNPAYSSPYTPKTAATETEVSFGSMSTSSRSSIPKLRGPKRDSSPIHAGRRSVARSEPRSEQGLLVSTLSPQSAQDNSNTEEDLMVQSMLKNAVPHGEHDEPEEFVTPQKPEMRVAPHELEPEPEQKAPDERAFKQRSVPVKPIATKPSEDSEPSTVRSLHDYWEARSSKPLDAQSAEWKTFLAKKVQAESTAAAGTQQRGLAEGEQDRDTIFDFTGSEGGFPSGKKASRGRRTNEPQDGAFDDISDLSPIRHDESDSDFVPSEASVPMSAHLAFLRSNPNVAGVAEKETPAASSRAVKPPPNLCGRPDVIVEEDTENDDSVQEPSPAPALKPVKSRSRSNPRTTRQKDDLSSVVSDEFGAKAAYFEALAMKAAVSGGSKKKKRSGTGSDVSGSTASKHSGAPSGASSKHSEKFQQFLDRRASKSGDSGSPPQPPRSMPDTKPPSGRPQDVSTRAERYASEKVDDLMEQMASNNNNVPLDYRGRPMDEETGAFPKLPRTAQSPNARAAAEDLAAARVEAMMKNLSENNLEADEGEI